MRIMLTSLAEDLRAIGMAPLQESRRPLIEKMDWQETRRHSGQNYKARNFEVMGPNDHMYELSWEPGYAHLVDLATHRSHILKAKEIEDAKREAEIFISRQTG